MNPVFLALSFSNYQFIFTHFFPSLPAILRQKLNITALNLCMCVYNIYIMLLFC